MSIQDIELLCTLGPASLDERTIRRLALLGVDLLRVNMSHVRIEDLARVVSFIQTQTDVPVCLDTEGAQVRTGPIVDGTVNARENRFITARSRPVPGDPATISFYPSYVVELLKEGDLLRIDFDSVLAQVIEKWADHVVLRVLNGGVIGQNKGVAVDRAIPMPPLTEKDRAAIEIGRSHGIRHYALSFANHAKDVDTIRELAGPDVKIIAKIETRAALDELDGICERADAVLIDRGDLSRDVPIERLPALQKAIIRTAKGAGRKIYVATNLLESMITNASPTRAEINDIYNTLADGADGLVLAAETAIGRDPVACAVIIVRMAHEFKTESGDDQSGEAISLLAEPHGGRLVRRVATEAEAREAARLPRIQVDEDALSDAEQIAFGTYSPLTGFMDRATLEIVLSDNVLPSGLPWTMPMVLSVGRETAAGLAAGARVALTGADGRLHSILDVGEVYPLAPERILRPWFGTDSKDHPGVARLLSRGSHLVGGTVTLVERRPSAHKRYDLLPHQLRMIFAHKGWSRVVGFHTRNPVHRGHEHIQLEALDRADADGLFISPVVGRRKTGDFLPDLILNTYQAMLDFNMYPDGRVVLGSFMTYPRYCGPREAVFTALCRKNMGCSHFIIGRDHTGVGDFYGPDENRALFDRIGDIGIEPLFFEPVSYDPTAEAYLVADEKRRTRPISGTEIRRALATGETVPEWLMRSVVQDVVRSEIAAGGEIFEP